MRGETKRTEDVLVVNRLTEEEEEQQRVGLGDEHILQSVRHFVVT